MFVSLPEKLAQKGRPNASRVIRLQDTVPRETKKFSQNITVSGQVRVSNERKVLKKRPVERNTFASSGRLELQVYYRG